MRRIKLTPTGPSALFWQHEADGSRVLTLAQSGGRYQKLAAIARGPVKGWVVQASSGQLIGCERYRRKAMRLGEGWVLGSLRVAHLKDARERGVTDGLEQDSGRQQSSRDGGGV